MLHKRSAVQNTSTKMDMITMCTNLRQSNSTVTLNTNTSYRYKKYNMNIPNILHYNQTIKIFHQNIRSLRNKTNELFCCIQEDPPHILCLTEHHLQYNESSYRTLKITHWGLTTVEIQNTWVVYVCLYKRTYYLLVWKLEIIVKMWYST